MGKPEFRCESYDKTTSTYRALKVHMASHNRLHKCPKCEQSNSSKCELKKHFRHHFTCQRDSEKAWRKYMVNKTKPPASEAVGTRSQPRRSVKQTSNIVDRQSSEPSDDTDDSEESDSEDSEDDFQNGVDPIPQHTTSTFESGKFQCDICFKILSSRRNVMNHMMIHSGELPHQCEICLQRFRLAQNLKRHRMQHSVTTIPQCPECGMLFQRQSDIKRHFPSHYSTKEEVEEAWNKFIGPKDPITDAPECEEIIDENNEDIQEEEEEPEDVVVRRFQCKICKKKLSSKPILKRHMNIHSGEKPFQCDICQKTYRQKYHLESHKRSHFVHSEIFKCPFCEATACHQHNLKRHFKKAHFKCKKTLDEEWKKYKKWYKCQKVAKDQKVLEDSDEQILEHVN